MADEEFTPRIADRTERNAANSNEGQAEPQPPAKAVTGRPVDPVPPNSTFADRAKARGKGAKAVDADDVEDKSVGSSERKSARGRR